MSDIIQIRHQALKYYQVCANDDRRLTFLYKGQLWFLVSNWISGERYRTIGPLVSLFMYCLFQSPVAFRNTAYAILRQ